jgi:hypothetical protein
MLGLAAAAKDFREKAESFLVRERKSFFTGLLL